MCRLNQDYGLSEFSCRPMIRCGYADCDYYCCLVFYNRSLNKLFLLLMPHKVALM